MSKEVKNKIQKHSRTLFFLLSWILLLVLIIQVSLVGLAITVDGGLWQLHRKLVYLIEFIPIFMFTFGCVGEIHKFYRTWSCLLYFFINFQYFTTYGWFSALHAAFALVIFIVSSIVAWGSYQIVVKGKKLNTDNMHFE